MSLIAQANEDIKDISTDTTDWAVPVTLKAPGGETANINAILVKTNLAVDTDGAPINSQTVRLTFSESALDGLGYPLRGLNGRVDMRGHNVTGPDSTGQQVTYRITQWMPDETIGLILCMCSNVTV